MKGPFYHEHEIEKLCVGLSVRWPTFAQVFEVVSTKCVGRAFIDNSGLLISIRFTPNVIAGQIECVNNEAINSHSHNLTCCLLLLF